MSLSITTRLIVEAAERRNWQIEVLNLKTNLLRITTPDDMFYLRNCRSHKGSGLTDYLSNDKHLFSQLVATIDDVSQPPSIVYGDTLAAKKFLQKHGEVVVKPVNLSHGEGITMHVTTMGAMEAAASYAEAAGAKQIIVQKQLAGDDYRVLVIGGKIVAAAIREPASVIGDGKNTIEELITIENKQPDRGQGYLKPKCYIDAAAAHKYLASDITRVPNVGEKVTVVGIANIGRGGLAIDMTDQLSKTIIRQTMALVQHFKLGMAGVDFIVDGTGNAYLIEINTLPSFGLHAYPVQGRPRLVADDFLGWVTS